jgi:hypothetical protein
MPRSGKRPGSDSSIAAARAVRNPRSAPNRQREERNAAQTPEGTQRPSDGPDDLAEKMFDGTPMDGVRYDEVELTSPNEFALEVPEDLAANLQPGEAQQIVGSFIEAGVGRTLAIDLVRQGIEASRRGPLADADIQQRNADGMAELRQKWGPKTAEKVQMARGMIDAAERKWPGVKAYLNATGLGSNPKLIQQLVARAERRPGRR